MLAGILAMEDGGPRVTMRIGIAEMGTLSEGAKYTPTTRIELLGLIEEPSRKSIEASSRCVSQSCGAGKGWIVVL